MTYEENNENTLRECASDLQNDSRTCEPRDTGLTQPCSLIVLARDLALVRRTLPPQKSELAGFLIQQIYRYDSNPTLMGKNILDTIERIEGARA